MEWGDEYDNGYDDIDCSSHRDLSIPDRSAKGGLDPREIVYPVSAYFFLDAQDEITGSDKKKMKCLDCGHMKGDAGRKIS